MNYAEAVEHLYALGPELAPAAGGQRRKFDLAHMRVLCAALGDPQDKFPSVLIAGSNGKGSTAATLASILVAAGYRTGLYTSPHLVRVTERIQISRHGRLQPISDEEFARLYTQVDEACEMLVKQGRLPFLPSFFERVTALAFLFYSAPSREERADLVVLEVGLGGRLDATNVVEPLLSVITDIALDHQAYLGDTIADIAREKAGILREGGVLVTLPQHPEANQAIGAVAMDLHVRGVNAADYLPPAERNIERDAARVTGAGEGLPRNRYRLHLPENSLQVEENGRPESLDVDSPLAGQHQQRNVALAIATAVELRNRDGYKGADIRNRRRYNIPNSAIEAGIRETRWPGRLEFVEPDLLLDVAHNPAGAWTLRSALSSLPQDRPRTLLFSCLSDKNITEMAQILFPLFDSSVGGDPLRRNDHIVLAAMDNPRAARIEDLLAAAHQLGIPVHAAPHVAGALAQARAVTPVNGLLVVTGSVYLIGEIRQLVLASGLHPELVPA